MKAKRILGTAADRKIECMADAYRRTRRKGRLLFWSTIIVPLGLFAIGIGALLNPVTASLGYGIPVSQPASFPYLWAAAIRDLSIGLALLTFVLKGDCRATGILFAITILIPVSDGLIVYKTVGITPAICLHWGGAIYMSVVAYFLLRRNFERRPIPFA
jgi:hypothetical protein